MMYTHTIAIWRDPLLSATISLMNTRLTPHLKRHYTPALFMESMAENPVFSVLRHRYSVYSMFDGFIVYIVEKKINIFHWSSLLLAMM